MSARPSEPAGETVLRTERLRLRPLVPEDAPALGEAFADAYALRFYPRMREPAEVRAWIARWLESYARDGLGLWALELRETGELVGDAGLVWQRVEGRPELEVGYHVVARYRSRGLATEAARACRDWGFEHTSAPRIGSLVHPENAASQRVAARIHPFVRRVLWHPVPHDLYYTPRPIEP